MTARYTKLSAQDRMILKQTFELNLVKDMDYDENEVIATKFGY